MVQWTPLSPTEDDFVWQESSDEEDTDYNEGNKEDTSSGKSASSDGGESSEDDGEVVEESEDEDKIRHR